MISDDRLDQLAARVDDAAHHVRALPQLTREEPELTLAHAYTIQERSLARRYARGERLIGMKMGLTSRAKMDQMGVRDPIFGHLTDAMQLPNGGTLRFEHYIHPRVEPEIAFIIGRELRGSPTAAEALRAVDGVCAAIEVIDSRYENFKFSLADVIADNASSSGFVLSDVICAPGDVTLDNLGMVMRINGEARQIGSSAAILGHPIRSLIMLVELLDRRGQHLKPGQIVLAGAATAAEYVHPGDLITLETDGLGDVELSVHTTQGLVLDSNVVDEEQ